MIQRGALVLASRSEARASVLRAAGLRFVVRAAALDEGAVKADVRAAGGDAAAAAMALAEAKARAVDGGGALVIGADQILRTPDDDAWFDKPGDMAGARGQLRSLRGRAHELVTAVACLRDGVTLWRHVARPCLAMRAFGDAFLEDYLAAEGPVLLACVGAYRVEGLGVQLFDRIEGEHAAIMGLPLLALLGFLRRDGHLAG